MQCKSHEKDGQCSEEATVTVFWPGRTTVACGRHAQGMQRVAQAMGFPLDMRPIGAVEQDYEASEQARKEAEEEW